MTKVFRKVPNSGGNLIPEPSNQFNFGNQKAVQLYNNSQVYFKGFTLGASAGQNSFTGIQLGGSARRLFGINMFVAQAAIADDDTFSLLINNELIIDKCLWRAFFPQQTGNIKQDMFFSIPRPLSGSDSVEMSYTSVTAKNIFPIFYLSNFAG